MSMNAFQNAVLGLTLICGTALAQTPGNPPQPADLGLATSGIKARDNRAAQPPDAGLAVRGTTDPDVAGIGSPVGGTHAGAFALPGTAVKIRMLAPLSSAQATNGQTVDAVLAAPLHPSHGPVLPAGTKVEATVVAAAKAGTIQSGGVLSLQLTSVGGLPVVSDVRDFSGREGHKDVADSAPAKGSEAEVNAGTELDFEVLQTGRAPGLVQAVPAASASERGARAPSTGTPGTRTPGTRAPGSGAGAGRRSSSSKSVGAPSTGPGVNQTPVNSASPR